MLAAGQWWLWYRGSDVSWFAFAAMALSEGELGSITGIELNDHPIDDLVGASSDAYVISYDSRAGADTQTITGSLSTVPGLVETWPGLAHVDFKLSTHSSSPIPGQMRLTAKVTGRKIADFRGGAAASTSNPVVIAYDLLINTEFGLGRSTSLVDVADWTAAADHCDTVMADGTFRYEFNGFLYERDLMRAIQTVLGHAMMGLEYDPAGGVYHIVTSRSDLSSVATITEDDWKSHTKWMEIPLPERPNQIVVSYTQEDTFRPASVTIEDPAGMSAGEIRHVEIPLPGCYSASHATRFGIKRYNHAFLERYRWHGDVGPVIADVLPGQIVTLNTRTLSGQLARLITKKQTRPDLYRCEFVEFDAGTDSVAIATDDTPPSVSVDPPDPPISAVKTFGEAGDWDLENLITSGPDDLSGWTPINGASVVYDGGNEWSTITIPAGGSFAGIEFDIGLPDVNQTFVVACLADTSDGDITITWDGLGAGVKGSAVFDGDGEEHRWKFLCKPGAGSTNKIIIVAGQTGSPKTIRVRRFRVQPMNFNTAMYLYEVDSWVEDPGAPLTVDRYVAINHLGREIGSVPVGESSLELRILTLGLALQDPGYAASFVSDPSEGTMIAIGPTGLSADFPTPTTDVEARLFQGVVERQEDTDIAARANGDAMIYNSSTKKWASEAIGVECPVCLPIYVDVKERNSEYNFHGGLLGLVAGGTLTNILTIPATAGIGKLMIVVNAGSDFDGEITVTGTTVDRNTGAETPADTDVLTIDALTTDSSDTDASGNVRHSFTRAYITSKWFKGAVVLSTSNLTLTDVDVYQVSFNQWNDSGEIAVDTLDFTAIATNGAAWAYVYLYLLTVNGDKCRISRTVSLELSSADVDADKSYRLRRGNIGMTIDGTTDGSWIDFFPGPLPNNYWENINALLWANITKPVIIT
jgi:hypothetical protein